MKTKEEFRKSLSPDIIGLSQAKRNRSRYIRQLGEIYHENSGKMSLYNMMILKEEITLMNIKPYPNNFSHMRWTGQEVYRQARLNELQNAKKAGLTHVYIGVSRIKTETAIRKLKQQMCEW